MIRSHTKIPLDVSQICWSSTSKIGTLYLKLHSFLFVLAALWKLVLSQSGHILSGSDPVWAAVSVQDPDGESEGESANTWAHNHVLSLLHFLSPVIEFPNGFLDSNKLPCNSAFKTAKHMLTIVHLGSICLYLYFLFIIHNVFCVSY